MPENELELSIVLPAYKEKENLAVFIPRIEEEFKGASFEIIVVDDNSKDGTRELLDTFNLTYRNIIFVERPALLGIGSALRDGFNKARGIFIMSVDADLSFTTQDMKRLFEKIREGYDLVLAYKTKYQLVDKDGFEGARSEKLHYLVSILGNWTVRIVSGLPYKNVNTSFRILRRDKWLQITTKENRKFFDLETILKFSRKHFRIAEIPVTFYERRLGASKVSFLKEAPRYFGKLMWYVFFDTKV